MLQNLNAISFQSPNLRRLEGKVAIVTGGTNGIGRKIVDRFVDHGAQVVFTGRDLERGQRTQDATGAVFVHADATAADSARETVEKALEFSGGIDILINNAGGAGKFGGIEKTGREDVHAAIAVHVDAPWRMMAEVAPHMRAGKRGGSIINIGSVAGQRVGAPYLAYSVAKAALLHLTRCAASEFGRDGIRVNSVSPGFIETSIHIAGFDVGPERQKEITALIAKSFIPKQALARTGTAEDVADAVVFLASDESQFITGADLVIDGGMMWGQYASSIASP